ncbi:MAG: SAF domain-containing protein [Nocardioides sp.]|nr:SAF domain-containing protein [Nocardioides sp.]
MLVALDAPAASLRRRLGVVRRHLAYRRRLVAAAVSALAVALALQALAPGPPPAVEVTVAARDLPAGARLVAGDLTTVRLPREAVPDGLAERPVGRMLAAGLRRGEPVSDVRLVGPALARARPGEQALPLRLPDAGMASLVQPGDVVDLLATDPGSGRTDVVATDVTVLAVPHEVPQGLGEGTDGALVVVSLAPDQVPLVAGASLARFLTIAFGR